MYSIRFYLLDIIFCEEEFNQCLEDLSINWKDIYVHIV